MELFKRKKKKDDKLSDLKKQGFDLEIEDVSQDDSDGYIFSQGMYRKILMIFPINSDFLEMEDLEQVKDKLTAVFNLLQRFQVMIQKESVDFSHFIANLEKQKENQTDILTQTKQSNLIEYVKKTGAKLSNKNVFYLTIEDKKLENLNNMIVTIKRLLNETHLTSFVLSKSEMLYVLYKRLCTEQFKINPIIPKNLEDIIPGNLINFKGMYQVIETEYQRTLAMSFYPENVPEFLWLKSLFKLDESINISIIANRKNSSEIIGQIDKNIQSKKIKLLDLVKESEIRSAEEEIKSSRSILSELSASNTSVFDVCILINIHANTEEILRDKVERVQTTISSLGFRYVEVLRKGFVPFIATLPILNNNRLTNTYTWNLLASDIGSLIIFDDSEFFRETGIPIGKNPDTSSIISFNPFDGSEFYNPHILIIGFTGSGKTFFIQYLTERLEAYTDYTIKLDVAGTLATPNSDRYIFSTDGNLTVNPFFIRSLTDSLADEEDSFAPVTEKVLDLLSFFKSIANFNEYELTILESCIRNTFVSCGITDEYIKPDATEPTFSTFEKIITMKKKYLLMQMKKAETEMDIFSYKKEYEALENINAYIQPFVQGAYSNLFNGNNNYTYTKNTTLDFSKLSEVLKRPLYNLVLKDLWRFCIKDGSNEKSSAVPRKVIVVDEEHEFVDQEETLKMISSKLIKQGRKYNAMVINATQDIGDLQINKHSEAILSNCNFKFLFKLGEVDHEKVQTYYNLTEKEMRVIRGNKLSAGKGEAEKGKGILIIDSLHIPFKSEATLEEIKIIDPALYRRLAEEN